MKRSKMRISGCGIVMLALLLLLAPNLFAQPDRGAGVSKDTLPEALKGLDIKDRFISSSFKKAGVIHALVGHVVVIHKANGEAYFGKKGDYICENDSLNTLAKSKCRVRLLNDDVLNMAPDTEFSIDTYQDDPKKRKKISLFSMLKGKVKLYALRLLRYKQTKVTIKTPTAIVGVRGTSFGVHVYWEPGQTAGNKGTLVADSGKDMGMYLASNGPQGGWVTNAYCEDGSLLVNGQTVGANQTYYGATNQVTGSNPGYVNQSNQDTSVGGEDGGGDGGPSGGGDQGGGDTGDQSGSGNPADLSDNATNTTSNQNAPAGGTTEQGTFSGYFCGMLTKSPSAAVIAHEVYVSATRQQSATPPETAQAIVDHGGYLEGRGTFGQGTTYGTRMVTDGGSTDSGDLGTTRPLTDQAMGTLPYLEWGWWTLTNPVTISGDDYLIDNRGFYAGGIHTPDEAMAGFRGSAYYYGGADGKYYNDPNDMTGSFDCMVNFDTPGISSFNMSLTNGQSSADLRGAQISNATGSFNSSSFDITGGTWQLINGADVITPDNKSCHGSLYGPDGATIGGVGGMQDTSTGDAAVFVFHGQKSVCR